MYIYIYVRVCVCIHIASIPRFQTDPIFVGPGIIGTIPFLIPFRGTEFSSSQGHDMLGIGDL